MPGVVLERKKQTNKRNTKHEGRAEVEETGNMKAGGAASCRFGGQKREEGGWTTGWEGVFSGKVVSAVA